MSEPTGTWDVYKVRDDEHGEMFAVKFTDPANEGRAGFSFSEVREVSESELRRTLQRHGVIEAVINDHFARARSEWIGK